MVCITQSLVNYSPVEGHLLVSSFWFVMVNFVCQFDQDSRCLDIWLDIILDMSMRVFPDEISIWMGRLNKADWFSPLWVGITQFTQGLNRIKRWRMGEFTLSAWLLRWALVSGPWIGTSPSPGFCSPGLQAQTTTCPAGSPDPLVFRHHGLDLTVSSLVLRLWMWTGNTPWLSWVSSFWTTEHGTSQPL